MFNFFFFFFVGKVGVIFLVWQRLRILGTFSHNTVQIFKPGKHWLFSFLVFMYYSLYKRYFTLECLQSLGGLRSDGAEWIYRSSPAVTYRGKWTLGIGSTMPWWDYRSSENLLQPMSFCKYVLHHWTLNLPSSIHTLVSHTLSQPRSRIRSWTINPWMPSVGFSWNLLG